MTCHAINFYMHAMFTRSHIIKTSTNYKATWLCKIKFIKHSSNLKLTAIIPQCLESLLYKIKL